MWLVKALRGFPQGDDDGDDDDDDDGAGGLIFLFFFTKWRPCHVDHDVDVHDDRSQRRWRLHHTVANAVSESHRGLSSGFPR